MVKETLIPRTWQGWKWTSQLFTLILTAGSWIMTLLCSYSNLHLNWVSRKYPSACQRLMTYRNGETAGWLDGALPVSYYSPTQWEMALWLMWAMRKKTLEALLALGSLSSGFGNFSFSFKNPWWTFSSVNMWIIFPWPFWAPIPSFMSIL